jgi:hypothetical protein
VNILRELFDLLSRDGINQSGLTDTISTNKTILFTLDELELSLLKESLATND